MMKYLFSLLLIVVANQAFSQNLWPSIGTKWYYSYRENPLGSPATGYVKFEVSKDTAISGQTCRIIEKKKYTTDHRITDLGKEYIYTENDRLYRYQKDRFYLLYDFSLAANDTFQIKLYSPAQQVDTIMNIVIDSVGDIQINNSTVKRYIYRPVAGSLSGWKFGGEVIDKIGNLSSLFPFNELECDAGTCASPLRCFESSSTSLHQSGFGCDELYTGIEEQNQTSDLLVYPNPAADYIYLRFKSAPTSSEVKLTITNSYGVRFPVGNYLISDNSIRIDVEHLPLGVYFVQAILHDKMLGKRIIKSN